MELATETQASAAVVDAVEQVKAELMMLGMENLREQEGTQELRQPESRGKEIEVGQVLEEARQPAGVDGPTGLFGQFPLGAGGAPETETVSGQRPNDAAGVPISVAEGGEPASSAPPTQVPPSPYDPSLGLGSGFGPTDYGGVYNPLEPQTEAQRTPLPVMTQPTSVSPLEGVAPSVAFPAPAYGRDLTSDILAGRAVVPIGGEPDGGTGAGLAVVRLPSTSSIETPPTSAGATDLSWYPSEGYPVTQVAK